MKKLRLGDTRTITMSALIITILCMVAGYAAFGANVEVQGNAEITGNWKVAITGIEVETVNGLATNSAEDTLVLNDTTAVFGANLQSPGDYITYKVTVANRGNLAAKLSDVVLTEQETATDEIKFAYSGVVPATYGTATKLAAGQTNVIYVTVSYDSTVTEQPTTTTDSATLVLSYAQDI